MLKQLSSNLPYSQIYRVIVVLKSVIKLKLIKSFINITANVSTQGCQVKWYIPKLRSDTYEVKKWTIMHKVWGHLFMTSTLKGGLKIVSPVTSFRILLILNCRSIVHFADGGDGSQNIGHLVDVINEWPLLVYFQKKFPKFLELYYTDSSSLLDFVGQLSLWKRNNLEDIRASYRNQV